LTTVVLNVVAALASLAVMIGIRAATTRTAAALVMILLRMTGFLASKSGPLAGRATGRT
jgi:hypothetical protein